MAGVVSDRWLAINSLGMLTAAGFYFWQGLLASRPNDRVGLIVWSAAIVNVALDMVWLEQGFTDPLFFLIPMGASVLVMVELLRAQLPTSVHNPLRYAGATLILVSPTFEILQGSWLHMLVMMVASVALLLLGIGTRVRALLFTGIGFLLADLTAMVVHGSIDHPSLLWIVGIGVGAAVIVLGAVCENNREKLLQRIRMVTSVLRTWQ